MRSFMLRNHESHPVTGQDNISIFRSALRKWGEENLRSFSWRKTSDPYEILIAEILLQKTAAEKVEPIYHHLLETYSTMEDLAEADQGELSQIIYSLGFQNQRAKALVEIGTELRGQGVPSSEAELLALPHVGRYAANATLCFAFDEPRAIVDENVVRVYNRFFGKNFGYRDEETWSFATQVLPDDDAQRFNLALLDFGAEMCTPKGPKCEDCLISECCKYNLSLA